MGNASIYALGKYVCSPCSSRSNKLLEGRTPQPREVRPLVHSKLLKERKTDSSSAPHSIRTGVRKCPRMSQPLFHQRGSAASSVSLLSPSKININARNNKKDRGTGGENLGRRYPLTHPPTRPPTPTMFLAVEYQKYAYVLATRPRRRKRYVS